MIAVALCYGEPADHAHVHIITILAAIALIAYIFHLWQRQATAAAPLADAESAVRRQLEDENALLRLAADHIADSLEHEKGTLKAFFQALPDMAWIKDGEGKYLACNPVFERFFGAHEADIVGKTDFDFVDTELATFFRQKDMEAIAKKRPSVNEERVTFASDGQHALLETIKMPIIDAQGDCIGVLGIAHDITERRRLETELVRRETEFRTLAENSPDIIVRYDRECRRIYCNPAFTETFSQPTEPLLGKTPAEISPFSCDVAEAYTKRVQHVIDNTEPDETELHWESNGASVFLQLRITPEFDSAGRVISALAIGRDVSAIKLAETHLRKSHDLLRALARHREGEHEAELRKIAREIHEELAQNLTALRMHISMLEIKGDANENPAPHQFKTMRDIVDRSVVRVRDMVSEVRPSVLDMGIVPALFWLANDFRNGLRFKFELDIQDDIRLDEEISTFLFRAAKEVLINAALHAAANHIDLSLKSVDGFCRMVIRDNGRGFDTTNPYPEGTFGLFGLAERARHVNGVFSIESTLGLGTTLKFEVPATPPAIAIEH